MTDEEYAALVAAYLAMTDKDLRCEHCLRIFEGRPNYERDNKHLREMKGCNGPVKLSRTTKLEKHHVVFSSCPGSYRDRGITYWVELWRQYRLGYLPFRGGLLDQPAKIMEAFRILDSLEAERYAELERANGRRK